MKSLIKLYIIYITVVCSTFANCNEFKLIDLDQVSIDYMSYFPGGRTPIISDNGLTNRMPSKGLDLNINTTISNYLYWNSSVISMTDSYSDSGNAGQFRSVGLQMETGVRLFPWLDVYYHHFSEHVLDSAYQGGDFPVLLDAVGIHLYLFRKDQKESIF